MALSHWIVDFSMKAETEDFLPLRPRRLISLWDMLQFSIRELVSALNLISVEEQTVKEDWPTDKEKEKTASRSLIEIVKKMQQHR